jgi:riboflavin synthase
MFTGIIEQVGSVQKVEESGTGKRLVISATGAGELPIGASIAVNGVCLTAVEAGGDLVSVDVIPETLKRSNLGSLSASSKVNLELPMRADGRFDGHIVQGHVDGLGTVMQVETDADGGVVMAIEVPGDLMQYVVEKGSVSIDGVSLTVAGVTASGFTVALIPHTLEVTTLGLRSPGDRVNLEMDVLAKYVERLMRR